jgi:hypothetical protein
MCNGASVCRWPQVFRGYQLLTYQVVLILDTSKKVDTGRILVLDRSLKDYTSLVLELFLNFCTT